jgi:alpha-glucoside transport system substrate-binding protein
MISRPKVVRLTCFVVLAAALVVSCTRSGRQSTPTAAAPTAAPTGGTAQSLTGARVRVLGLWSGPEFDNFATVKASWEKATGGVVDWEGTEDLPGVLAARLQAGNPPDIAVLPNLALLRQLAQSGTLIPLSSVLEMDRVHQDYPPAWVDLGSYDGKLYGIFYKVTNKATVWYSPKAFKANDYRVPRTWDDTIALADHMVADGHTPFSIVAARGPASGWALTDWISQIVLNSCGPTLYDKWIAADIPWTDACIKQSFRMFTKIVKAKGYVLGGSQRILATTDEDGGNPLYSKPPNAYMYYLASFAQGFIAAKYPNLKPGRDYGFFSFPTINDRYRGSVTIGADVVVMVKDSPSARSFMNYLAGARAQEAWIKLGGFTSVNRSVSAAAYPDPVARAVAEDLAEAKVSRFSAGDMMPAPLQRAWWRGMLELVQDPRTLDSMLTSLTRVAQRTK